MIVGDDPLVAEGDEVAPSEGARVGVEAVNVSVGRTEEDGTVVDGGRRVDTSLGHVLPTQTSIRPIQRMEGVAVLRGN